MSNHKASPPRGTAKAAVIVVAAIFFIIGAIFIGLNSQHAREQADQGKTMTPSKVN